MSFDKKLDVKFLGRRSRVALMAHINKPVSTVVVLQQIHAFNAGHAPERLALRVARCAAYPAMVAPSIFPALLRQWPAQLPSSFR